MKESIRYVHRNITIRKFGQLTDETKEINREISRELIEIGRINNALQNRIKYVNFLRRKSILFSLNLLFF